MDSEVPMFNIDIIDGMDLINMEEVMTTDELEGLPKEEESVDLKYREILTFEDLLGRAQNEELVEVSDVMDEVDQSTVGMDVSVITDETVQGFSLPWFPVTFTDFNELEPMTNFMLHNPLEDQVVLEMVSPKDLVENDIAVDPTLPHVTPMLEPVTENGCAVANTEMPEAHDVSTNVSSPSTKKKCGRKASKAVEVSSSNANKNDEDPIQDKEQLLKLRRQVETPTRKLVPDWMKDEDYYEKRSRNRMAAGQSRQKKRQLDESRISIMKSVSEEIEQLKLEIAKKKVLEQKYIQLQTEYRLLQSFASNLFPGLHVPEGDDGQ